MSKNSQNNDKNVEKPSKYRPKCRKAVKPVEKSLKTAKNTEKAQNDKNCRKTAEMFKNRQNTDRNVLELVKYRNTSEKQENTDKKVHYQEQTVIKNSKNV